TQRRIEPKEDVAQCAHRIIAGLAADYGRGYRLGQVFEAVPVLIGKCVGPNHTVHLHAVISRSVIEGAHEVDHYRECAAKWRVLDLIKIGRIDSRIGEPGEWPRSDHFIERDKANANQERTGGLEDEDAEGAFFDDLIAADENLVGSDDGDTGRTCGHAAGDDL